MLINNQICTDKNFYSVHLYARHVFFQWLYVGIITSLLANASIILGKRFLESHWLFWAIVSVFLLSLGFFSVWCMFVSFLYLVFTTKHEPRFKTKTIKITKLKRLLYRFPHNAILVDGCYVDVKYFHLIGYRYLVQEVSYVM